MSTRTGLAITLVSLLLAFWPAAAQQSGFRVFADKAGRVHVVAPSGREQVVPGEPNQIGIESAQTARDAQTVGWLVDYADPDSTSPDAAKLVVFRSGRIIRRFETDQVFWSWAFFSQGRQVAYHVGPTHGEQSSHCELHDVESGRRLADWNGDLDDSKRPEWVRVLSH